MSKRLGGRKGHTANLPPDRVDIHKLASMSEAVERYQKGVACYSDAWPRNAKPPNCSREMLNGDSQLPALLDEAERFIESALLEDPRLVKRAGWVRSEDGVDADAALVAAGEERCCLDRRKMRVADQSTLEPVRIVISTDSKEITPCHASAFIAAARLAQQFRPLEVWWQGAWLMESGQYAGNGTIFLVPLIQGDMDFSRLQFVLSSPLKDHASYRIMFSYTWPVRRLFGGGVGPRSYLDNTFDFVSEKGIEPSASYIAQKAAEWAGLEPLYRATVGDYEAAQWWEPSRPVTESKWTREDERRYQERRRESERSAKQQAKARLSSLSS